MTSFSVPEYLKKKNVYSALIMLVMGVFLMGLGGWMVFGGNIFSLVGGILGISMGLFIVFASIRTLRTIKESHPAITIDDTGFEIGGEKDPSENK